jgi:CubicO group peptidase (beta-lactamase class C family)
MFLKTYLFLIFIILSSVLFSCKRFASEYPLRKTQLSAIDSVLWYDSLFAEEKYILDTILDGRFSRGAFNGNILCALNGKIFYERSLGYCNIFSQDTLQCSNSFQLASVSKPFTSTAILQLCEQGRINLNDTIERFFPDFPYSGITVKMLLTHRSGLPDYIKFTDRYYRNQLPEYIDNDSVMALMKFLKPRMLARPNQKYEYSNTGYMVLASIVEKVTGDKFSEYLKTHIFFPCKMNSTYLYDLKNKNLDSNSVIAFEDDAEVNDHYHNGVVGDKGVYSTVEDLLLFDQALRKQTILSKQWQDSAYAKEVPEWVGDQNYGLGWRLRDGLNHENIIYHTDLTRGFTIVVFDNVRNNARLPARQGFFSVNDLLWVFDKNKTTIFF